MNNQDIQYAESIVEKIKSGHKMTNLINNKISTPIFNKIIELLNNWFPDFDKIDVFIFLIKFDMEYDFKSIYNLLYFSMHDMLKTFVVSCRYKNIFYPKWILFNYINCYENIDEYFVNNCKYGFIEACKYGNIEIAKWLYELKKKTDNLPVINNISFNNNEALKEACINDHIEIAQWLYNINPIHIKKNDDFVLKCLENCGIDIARWLISITE